MSLLVSPMTDLVKVLAAKSWITLSLFASGVIIARFTSPEAYGQYAAALSLVLLLDGAIGAPLDMTGVRYASLHGGDANRVNRILVYLAALKMLLAVGAVLLLAVSVHTWNVPSWPASLVGSVAFACVAVMLLRSVMNYLQVTLQFGGYSLLDVGQATARILVVLAMGWAGLELAGTYVFAYGLGAAAVAVPGVLLARRTFAFAGLADRRDRRDVLRYAAGASLVVILGTITGRSDILILEAGIGAGAAAEYAAAFHVASVLTLLGGYVSVVSQPRILAWAKAGTLGRMVAANVAAGATIGAAAVGLTLLLPELLGWLFGAAFSDAAPLLTVLAIGTSLDLAIMPLLLPFALQWRPRHALIAESCTTIAFLAVALGTPDISAESMAWLVTCVRAAKLTAYLAIFLFGRRTLRLA